MSTNPTFQNPYSPGIQSLIPMFYTAWSDKILTPTEVEILKSKALSLSFLSEDDKATLLRWSDPRKAPSRQLFKFWEIELHKASEQILENEVYSLVDLGIVMAQQASKEQVFQKNVVLWTAPEVREELESIETLLKAVSVNAYRNIFSKQSISQQWVDEKLKARFSIDQMVSLLDGDYGDLKNEMRALLSDPIFNYKTLRVKDDYREQVLAWCKLLADRGYGSLAFPAEYGGQNAMDKYIAIFEMLGFHDLSMAIKFGVHFGLFGGSVLWLGTEIHHEKYLSNIASLALPGCFAMTETGHGSNVRGLETTATYDPLNKEFIIDTPHQEAGKEYIGNALHGHMATVFAQLLVSGENHGVHAVLVPIRSKDGQLLPGIRVEDCGYKIGLNGVDNGRIWFDNVRVPKENLLNRFGDVDEDGNYFSPIENPSKRFFTMLGTLVGGRVSVPKAGISAAKSGLTIAIKYALKRRQFGPKFNEPETLLLDYPSHQRRLMPLLAKVYALDFALKYLADRYLNQTEKDSREIESLAAGLKAYATWFTTETLQECREACGGKGYLSENRLGDLKADTDIFTTFEGDNTVLMQLVAKGVLSDFQKDFHEEGIRAVLRYIGDRVGTAILELNPIAIRKVDKDHLLDEAFHLSAFRYRERRMLYAVAQRFRGWIKRGLNSYDAFLKCQTHMLGLAEAYIERVVLEQFVEKISQVKENELNTCLKNLCSLFALSTIEKHKGWYLEHDYLASVKTKAIRREIDGLCLEVRKDAHGLVEAFAIPDACLGAQIVAN